MDIDKISEWANMWQVKFNPDKTETIQFTRKRTPVKSPLTMQGTTIKEVQSHKHLGITLQNDCTWKEHISDIVKKVGPMINCLRSYKYRLSRKTLEIMYKSYILPMFDYCSHVWDNCTNEQSLLLENLNLDALRTICGAVRGTSHQKIYSETNCKPLRDRRYVSKLTTFYKMTNNLVPDYVCQLVPPTVSSNTNYNLRNSSNIRNLNCRTVSYANTFLPSTVNLWNNLPDPFTSANTIREFKSLISPNLTTISIFDLNSGSRFCQIIHCRLRLGCSDLNGDKYNRHLITNPTCHCGYHNEDDVHYFFKCASYQHYRNNMYFYSNGFDLKSVFYGNLNKSATENTLLLNSIHQFIVQTDRFNSH